MSASRSFRRLVGVACMTTLVLMLAVVSPLLVNLLLTGEPVLDQKSLLICLLLPTQADWPAHLLSYALAALLLVGILLGACSGLGQWYKTYRSMRALLRFAQPANNEHEPRWSALLASLEMQGRVDVVVTEKSLAFCYGLIKPRICVSTGALNNLTNKEAQALLLHEQYHLLHRDPLKTVISRVFSSAFFFLPIMRALQRQYLVAKEIEADRHVILNQRTDGPLLSALYKLLLLQTQNKAGKTHGLAVVGADDAINQRLDYLLDGRLPMGLHTGTLLVSSAMIAGISVIMLFATWAAAGSALWQQAHSSLGAC